MLKTTHKTKMLITLIAKTIKTTEKNTPTKPAKLAGFDES
jgi:hypothetical protein